MQTKPQTKENYEDYSSGRVLYGFPGATNFSVRLISDIFDECARYLTAEGHPGPYSIYDPFCGAGYSLTVLGLIHGSHIKNIFASDINKTILEFAHKNLSLLTSVGINHRIAELKNFIAEYKKQSHKDALKSAEKLQSKAVPLSIKINEFQFDMLAGEKLPKQVKNIDMVITDVPYGKLTAWTNLKNNENPVQASLDKIKDRLSKNGIVAIVANKKQEISYKGYIKVKALKFPKRKVFLLKLVE